MLARKVKGRHLQVWAVALALLGSSCAAGGGAPSPSTASPPAAHPGEEALPPGDPEDGDEDEGLLEEAEEEIPAERAFLSLGPSALEDMSHPDFPEPLVDPGEIIPGGPPPDGIPPIDDPQFVSVEEAEEWLEPEEAVVYVEMEGEVRAYPVQILIWHEIVNDTVGGVPVTVTYCPLCNSAVSYQRTVRGIRTTFGTSGRLYNSALVMYDRATESLWTHYDGRAVVGHLAGEELEPIPSPLVAFGEFASANPDALVLDRRRTGHSRPYGANPYGGYDDPTRLPFLFTGQVGDEAGPMQRVVGVSLGDESRAWLLEVLAQGEAHVTHAELGGRPLVIFWKSGQASALDRHAVAGGRDVGSVAVFVPEVGERELTFRTEGAEFVDEETRSRWNILGRAVEGELAGQRLEQVHHLDTFWFAWASYHPETELVSG